MAIIVAAGVMNTALMAVFERTREVGTLRAVGARRARVLVAVPDRGGADRRRGRPGRGRAGRGPRRLLRPLRHPGLQRGAALLVRRRLPVPGAERRRPRHRSRGDAGRLRAGRLRSRGDGGADAAGGLPAVRVTAAPRHRLPQPAARAPAQPAVGRNDGARHRGARAGRRAVGRDRAPAHRQPRGRADRPPPGRGAARRLRAAEQPLRRLRPRAAAGRGGAGPPHRGGGEGRRASSARCRISTAAGPPSPATARPWPASSASCPSEEPELRAAHPADAGVFLPGRRPAGHLRRGAGRAQAAPCRRRLRLLRHPDPAGRGELRRRRGLRRLPQGRPLVRRHLLRAAGRRAGAVRPAGRRHQHQDDARRRQQRVGAADAAGGGRHRGRRPRASSPESARGSRPSRRRAASPSRSSRPTRPRSPSSPPSCSWPPRWASSTRCS